MKGHYKLQATIFIENDLLEEKICESITDWLNDEITDFPEYTLPFLMNPNRIISLPITMNRQKIATLDKEFIFNQLLRSIGMGLYMEMQEKQQS